MNSVNDEFLERYQKLWEADQSSRAFAPLAEAYRRSGHLQKALQTCRQGLNLHPSFAGGWYQLAKVYVDREESAKAIEALKKAVSLAPENIQAHLLLADLYLGERKPKEALKSFKMVLLLNPDDSRAKRTIERLESLTADEYDPETFQIGNDPQSAGAEEVEEFLSVNLNEIQASEDNGGPGSPAVSPSEKKTSMERALQQTITLVDALLVRNEFTKAKTIILKAFDRFGQAADLNARLAVIEQQQEKSFEDDSPEIIQPVPPRAERIRLLKIEKLEQLLKKFKAYEGQV